MDERRSGTAKGFFRWCGYGMTVTGLATAAVSFFLDRGVSALFWTGLVAAAVGLLLAVITGRRNSVGSKRELLGGVSIGVAAVAIASGAVVVVYEPVEHSTAEAAGETVTVPFSVGEVSWMWETPRDTSIQGVYPVPSGALVHVSDGVVAVDTVTGMERWRYRRPGRGAHADVAPDGQTAFLAYFRENWDGLVLQGVVLDVETGRILEEYEVDSADKPDLLAAGVRIDLEGERGEVSAYELAGDRRAWTREGDPECVVDDAAVFDDLLLQASVCAEPLRGQNPVEKAESLNEVEARVLALDAVTGEERWRRVWRTRGFLPELLMPRDGRLLPESGDSDPYVLVMRGSSNLASQVEQVINLGTGEFVSGDVEWIRSESSTAVYPGPDSLVLVEQAGGGVERWSLAGKVQETARRPDAVFEDGPDPVLLSGAVVWLAPAAHSERGQWLGVHVVPWEGGKAERVIKLEEVLEIVIPPYSGDVMSRFRVLPVPGAVIVYAQHENGSGVPDGEDNTRIVGIS